MDSIKISTDSVSLLDNSKLLENSQGRVKLAFRHYDRGLAMDSSGRETD